MYDNEHGLYVAHCEETGAISMIGRMANRHGLVAGATGTGKTVTLQVLAETFCQVGVPCFMADMKGDLSGICRPGRMSSFIEKRLPEFGISDPQFAGCPVRFYDVFGEQGHPMRTTVSQMGPDLLARLLGLNETQAGVLNIVFRIADDRGLLLDDMKDLRAMLDYASKNAKEYTTVYGNITAASVGAIQRALLALDSQGADKFFGRPAFDINDLMATHDGRGVMSVLAADRLMLQPKLYSTFLMWLISELYTTLPEVGDRDLPRLVFFFDEAHTLFEDTPKALVSKIEQVIRLIRSKGVGIYFVTQSPTDIPENILGQLGNRFQHALRAYTPKDQKAVRVAADTFRANPNFNTADAIMNLETGEALVSVLDEKGAPSVVQRARMLFPLSQIGAITEGERADAIKGSPVYGKYDKTEERESAFEVLLAQSEAAVAPSIADPDTKDDAKTDEKETKPSKKAGLLKRVLKAVMTAVTATIASIIGTKVSETISGTPARKSRTSTTGRIAKNATSAATRTITRDILGNLIK